VERGGSFALIPYDLAEGKRAVDALPNRPGLAPPCPGKGEAVRWLKYP
jgi:hypothetical protein